ncbi:GspE/PulE family protein [Aureivirga marina]|uniref:GspE/PulE family protein n=1 Tax=Aureivirga marina TaxID=1182451 RepID=UPI0018CA08C3|nr:GspE/PulE family protein [Aureivirga marina]
MQIDNSHIDLLEKEMAWHYRIIPFDKQENTLFLYSDQPENFDTISEEVEALTGFFIQMEIIPNEEIEQLLAIHYRKSKNDFIQNTSSQKPSATKGETHLIEKIIFDAIAVGSSDIHLEIYKDEARVRIRIDGLMVEKSKLDKEEYYEIVNRIKIQSNLDITEKRLPQDGRTHLNGFDIRVSILPTLHGEKIVMRILGQDATNIDIHKLGLHEKEKYHYLEATKKKHGIILISGPTGSGKTTTLYATLKILNEIKRNIVTVEDPIEYTLDGINQVQLKENIGLTFTSVLRSFLRQDPDVIMLGEIRDSETAEMAIRASLTGHLVLSTIHTNSAWGTITRLTDMGIPPFLLSETLNISVAQRLVRKLCPHCKKEEKIEIQSLPFKYQDKIIEESHFVAKGCSKCHFTGYQGRTAIYEIIPIDPELSKLIKEEVPQIDEVLKRKEIVKLSDKAFDLFQKGETSLEEIYAILIQ